MKKEEYFYQTTGLKNLFEVEWEEQKVVRKGKKEGKYRKLCVFISVGVFDLLSVEPVEQSGDPTSRFILLPWVTNQSFSLHSELSLEEPW